MMKKNRVLVIVLTCMVFLSAVILGISTVFRVDTVTLKSTIISQAAQEEITDLQQRLQKAYDKDSTFFVNDKEAEEIMKDFPYFRMTAFEKKYPNRIEICVVEDEELYALPVQGKENVYYIIGKDGIVLGERDSYVNRLDNQNNLLITGLNVTGEKGKMLMGDTAFSSVLAFCNQANETLGGARRNVLSVEVIRMTSQEEDTMFKITMKEGVKIYVRDLMSAPTEKAAVAFEKYLSLQDTQRLMGRIVVLEQAGEFAANYAEKDEFNL